MNIKHMDNFQCLELYPGDNQLLIPLFSFQNQ